VVKIIEYGFESLQLNSIVAGFQKNNLRSLKLLERNGFVYEGTEDNYLIYSLEKPNP